MSFPRRLRISEFCKTGSGGTPSRRKSEFYTDGTILWVKSGELRENIILDTSEKITEEAIQKSSAKIVPKGSLLLAMYGATVGRLAFLGIDATTNQAICNIQPDEDIAFPKYLYYALLNKVPEFLSLATGGAQPNISQTLIKDTKILLPPLKEQKRIAAILDKADAIRRKRQQAIDLTDQLLRSVFLDMFGDPVTNPKGWVISKLGSIVTTVSGGTPLKSNKEFWSGEFPWVSPKDMKVNIIADSKDHISESVFLKTNQKRIPKDALLIVVRGMILVHTVPIGITAREVSINQDIKALLPNKSIEPVYLLYCLKTMHSYLLSKVSTAAHGTKRIEMDEIFNIDVILPESNKQKIFSKIVKKHLELKLKNEEHMLAANNIFDSITQQAFIGKLNKQSKAA